MDATQIPRPTKGYHTKQYPSISPSRPELSLEGKSVLITGGATGIGFAITTALAQAGAAKIALLARSQGPMDAAKKAIEVEYPGTKVTTHAAGVSDYQRVDAIVTEVGTIDVLILNAATVHAPAPILDVSTDEVENVFKTNVLGPLHLAKAFATLPPRSPEAERKIIFTSSAGFSSAWPGIGMYNASKPALNYVTTMIAMEYAAKHIRAFAFHPGVVFTPMTKSAGLDENSFNFDSADLAGGYAVWLCSPEANFLNGKFTWAHWDVDDLMAKKDLIENDPSQLVLGVNMDKLLAN